MNRAPTFTQTGETPVLRFYINLCGRIQYAPTFFSFIFFAIYYILIWHQRYTSSSFPTPRSTLNAPRYYPFYPATLITSSKVVIPCIALSSPLSFSVFIPFLIAVSLIILLEAFEIINALISSSKTISSYIEVLP